MTRTTLAMALFSFAAGLLQVDERLRSSDLQDHTDLAVDEEEHTRTAGPPPPSSRHIETCPSSCMDTDTNKVCSCLCCFCFIFLFMWRHLGVMQRAYMLCTMQHSTRRHARQEIGPHSSAGRMQVSAMLPDGCSRQMSPQVRCSIAAKAAPSNVLC